MEAAFHFGSTAYEHGHVVKLLAGAEVAHPQNGTEYQVSIFVVSDCPIMRSKQGCQMVY
jgi:hypothetical protein